MTEPKFTPATWKQDGFHIYGENGMLLIAKATVFHNETTEANANLIAAAPELYTELEKCAKLLRSYEIHHLQKGDREKADRNRRRAENCEKVLAKARGE